MINRARKAIWAVLVVILAAAFPGRAEETPPPIEAYRLEIRIDAPADFIYPYLVEEPLIARWNQDDEVEVTLPRGPETRVGKQVRVSLKVPTRPWMLMEITRLEPGREVVTEFVDGVLEGSFSYRLEAMGEESTLLIHEMRIRPVGALVTVVWKIHGEKMHRRKMKTFMERIKQVVEGDYQAGGGAAAGPS